MFLVTLQPTFFAFTRLSTKNQLVRNFSLMSAMLSDELTLHGGLRFNPPPSICFQRNHVRDGGHGPVAGQCGVRGHLQPGSGHRASLHSRRTCPSRYDPCLVYFELKDPGYNFRLPMHWNKNLDHLGLNFQAVSLKLWRCSSVG